MLPEEVTSQVQDIFNLVLVRVADQSRGEKRAEFMQNALNASRVYIHMHTMLHLHQSLGESVFLAGVASRIFHSWLLIWVLAVLAEVGFLKQATPVVLTQCVRQDTVCLVSS